MIADLVVVGEAMIQLSPGGVALAQADELSVRVAGAETNVASWAAASGLTTAWVGALGDDALGDRVIREVERYGVNTQHVVRDPSAPTGVFFKERLSDSQSQVLYYRKGSAASRLRSRAIVFPRARAIHVTGVTLALSSTAARLARAAVSHARADGALVSFDVNFRPGLWSVKRARRVVTRFGRLVDLIFVGRDEAVTLWGTSDPDALTSRFPRARIVVKDSGVGATSLRRGDNAVFEPALAAEIVEVVGAGDAFAAGYLTAALRDCDEIKRLKEGHRYAVMALGVHGDLPAATTIRRTLTDSARDASQERPRDRRSRGSLE